MQGKGIVVTGAFGALGRAVADLAAARGAKVAGLDLAPAPAGFPGRGLGGVDLTDAGAVARAVDEAATALGGVDILVNVAGGFRWETVADGSADTWALMHRMNLTTAVTVTRAALPRLLASPAGAIVNIGAGAAVKAGAGMGAYAASKAGVHRFTEALAEELKGRVTVNAVLPSTIDTPANRRDMPDADFSRWVAPADLADAIFYLAANRAITGALVPVTGGV